MLRAIFSYSGSPGASFLRGLYSAGRRSASFRVSICLSRLRSGTKIPPGRCRSGGFQMWSVQRVSNQRHPPGWRAFCLLNYARKMRLAALSGSASFPRFGSPAVLRRMFYPCGVRWRPCKVSSLCIRPSSFSGCVRLRPCLAGRNLSPPPGNGGCSWSAALTGWPPRL